MAAPKFGTLVPNRIFVGGISATTSEADLTQLFSAYGNVKATKIISDRAGVSKGYGFVTFETDEEARRLQQESECIILRERKLNIAPAIKKQPFNRSFDVGSGSPPAIPTNTFYYTNGTGFTYQNGLTFYNTGAPQPGTPVAAPTDTTSIYQTAGVFGPQAASGHHTFAPVVYSCPTPSLYMPQQYQYSPMTYESYFAGAAAGGGLPQYTLYATDTCSTQQEQQQMQQGQNNSYLDNNVGGSSIGAGAGNGTSNLSTLTSMPPQLGHFYVPSVPPPPPHHPRPPMASGPILSQPQLDHLYYSFSAIGPPPTLPQTQNRSVGIGDQPFLLYTTDYTNCQSSDSQVPTQEVQFYAAGPQIQSRYHHHQMSHQPKQQQQHTGQRRYPGMVQSMTPSRKFLGSSSPVRHGSEDRFRRPKINGIMQNQIAPKAHDAHCLGGGGDATSSSMVNKSLINPMPRPGNDGAHLNTIDTDAGNNENIMVNDTCHQIQTLTL